MRGDAPRDHSDISSAAVDSCNEFTTPLNSHIAHLGTRYHPLLNCSYSRNAALASNSPVRCYPLLLHAVNTLFTHSLPLATSLSQ